MRLSGAWVLFALLAGCLLETKDPVCGNSVQCGNPTKIAALQPTTMNGLSGGGSFYPTPYTIRFGESLAITLDTEFISKAAGFHGEAYVYRGFQNPVFDSAAADSFPLAGNSIVLRAADLRRAKQAIGDTDPDLFPFSMRITLRIEAGGLVFDQEALLAGLGVTWQNGKFVASDSNPLLDSRKIRYLTDPNGFYEGTIRPWDSLYAPGASAYVYVPGSPYHSVINVTNGHFRLDSLPYDLPFEVRLLVVPGLRPDNGKVPAYILTSEPPSDSLPNRVFRIRPTRDSVELP